MEGRRRWWKGGGVGGRAVEVTLPVTRLCRPMGDCGIGGGIGGREIGLEVEGTGRSRIHGLVTVLSLSRSMDLGWMMHLTVTHACSSVYPASVELPTAEPS